MLKLRVQADVCSEHSLSHSFERAGLRIARSGLGAFAEVRKDFVRRQHMRGSRNALNVRFFGQLLILGKKSVLPFF